MKVQEVESGVGYCKYCGEVLNGHTLPDIIVLHEGHLLFLAALDFFAVLYNHHLPKKIRFCSVHCLFLTKILNFLKGTTAIGKLAAIDEGSLAPHSHHVSSVSPSAIKRSG